MFSLKKKGRYIGLLVNEKNTKYMFITRNIRDDEDESYLEVDGIFFQQVQDFKYFGVNINNMELYA